MNVSSAKVQHIHQQPELATVLHLWQLVMQPHKSPLLSYFHHYFYLIYFFTAQRSRLFPEDLGYSLKCQGLTTHLAKIWWPQTASLVDLPWTSPLTVRCEWCACDSNLINPGHHSKYGGISNNCCLNVSFREAGGHLMTLECMGENHICGQPTNLKWTYDWPNSRYLPGRKVHTRPQ